MPWSSAQASKHKKGLSKGSQEKWSSIANSILAETGDEAKAIRIANARTKAIKRRLSQSRGV